VGGCGRPLCDTASFVVRSFVRWPRVLRLRKIVDEASGSRLADNSNRNMQIPNMDALS
jgi:hypothetical protein